MSRTYKPCEECKIPYKSKSIVYFKGKFLCPHCKKKVSKSMYLPTINQVVLTKKDLCISVQKVKGSRGRPKKEWNFNDSPVKITQEARLKAQEEALLSRHLYKEGKSPSQIKAYIKKMKLQIKKSHKLLEAEYKRQEKEAKAKQPILSPELIQRGSSR